MEINRNHFVTSVNSLLRGLYIAYLEGAKARTPNLSLDKKIEFLHKAILEKNEEQKEQLLTAVRVLNFDGKLKEKFVNVLLFAETFAISAEAKDFEPGMEALISKIDLEIGRIFDERLEEFNEKFYFAEEKKGENKIFQFQETSTTTN